MTFFHREVSQKNDKGYTLVELIVVVAILMAMAGVVGLGMTVMFSRDAEQVAKAIDDQMSEARMSAMSKTGAFSIAIHTSTDGDDNWIEIEKGAINLVKLAPGVASTPTPAPSLSPIIHIDFDKDAYIAFGVKDSVPSATDKTIRITFNKADGSVSEIDDNGTIISGSDLDKVYEIKCTGKRNRNKSASVLLMPVTGRHYINR